MSLPSGAVFATGEVERISKALEALVQDNHAPREISVKVILHVHNEYPRILYKGKKVLSVQNQEEAENAANEGYGSYDHEAFNLTEEY